MRGRYGVILLAFVSINSQKGENVSCTVDGPPTAPTSLLSHHDVQQTHALMDLTFSFSITPQSAIISGLDSGCVNVEGRRMSHDVPAGAAVLQVKCTSLPSGERTHLPPDVSDRKFRISPSSESRLVRCLFISRLPQRVCSPS